jgi:NADPH:quinone reductase-like Zn-dependent oxidoreductase
VIAAGEAAQGLIGKRVAAVAGGMCAVSDRRCAGVPCLPEGVSAEQGASAFVNPLTALSFVEADVAEGFTGLVHTAQRPRTWGRCW